MILISVKSEVVDDKQQFTTDRKAMKFLKTINNLHNAHRLKIAGKRPVRKDYKGRGSVILFAQARERYKSTLASCINLRVEIINTKYNQLALPL